MSLLSSILSKRDYMLLTEWSNLWLIDELRYSNFTNSESFDNIDFTFDNVREVLRYEGLSNSGLLLMSLRCLLLTPDTIVFQTNKKIVDAINSQILNNNLSSYAPTYDPIIFLRQCTASCSIWSDTDNNHYFGSESEYIELSETTMRDIIIQLHIMIYTYFRNIKYVNEDLPIEQMFGSP